MKLIEAMVIEDIHGFLSTPHKVKFHAEHVSYITEVDSTHCKIHLLTDRYFMIEESFEDFSNRLQELVR